MKAKKILKYAAFCFTLFCLMIPGICSAAEWGDLDLDIVIADTERHEWYVDLPEYNPIENEFLTLYHTSGSWESAPCTGSIEGRRLSPEGDILGEIVINPPEVGYRALPKPQHNVFTNEYMVSFIKGEAFAGRDIWITRLDSLGNIVYGPVDLTHNDTNSSHPEVVFNPQEREYLLVYNDYILGESANIGFLLEEDGSIIKSLFGIGVSPGDWIMFNPQGAYNPTSNTYMLNWEDFRHGTSFRDPSDIYGALVDEEGETISEFAMIDDYGEAVSGDQRVQAIEHNPDMDNFIAVWSDRKSSLEDGSGITGRIINVDGTPAGPVFVAADGPGSQSTPKLTYVEDRQQYFMVWPDSRNSDPNLPWFMAENDIFAGWLSDTGEPVGDEIPIYVGEGNQTSPSVVYNPVMKRLLITWREMNVDEYADPICDEGHHRESAGDILGKIYGLPSFISGRVIEEGTEDPVEGAKIIVVMQGPAQMTETNVGGWFNIVEDSQPMGSYMLVVSKPGYKAVRESLSYEGEPMSVTIEISKQSAH